MLQDKTDSEILRSMLAEVAKATAEMKCAAKDVEKVANRLNFTLVLLNEMINRQGD